MIGIYKITSPSGRIYIGQTIDINKRQKYYSNGWCKSQIKLYNSIIKYGWLNHVFEIIEECDFIELNNKERYWQEFFDCVENGLNCMYVQTDILPKKLSKETKNKMSLAGKGKIFSQETRDKISIGIKKLNGSYTKYRKERYGTENHATKIILDTQTGIFYIGSEDAAASLNIKEATLRSWLRGDRRNKSYLQYV